MQCIDGTFSREYEPEAASATVLATGISLCQAWPLD